MIKTKEISTLGYKMMFKDNNTERKKLLKTENTEHVLRNDLDIRTRFSSK